MNIREVVNNRFHRVDGREFVEGIVINSLPDVKEKDSQLLDYIFSCDPNTGLPKGDLAMFLGEGTNQEVKTFIQMNLMKDNVQSQSEVSFPTDVMNKMREVINDDDIAYFSRNHGETSEQYAERMHIYFEEERYKNALRQENARVQKLLKDSVKDN